MPAPRQGNIRIQIRHSRGRIIISANETDKVSDIKKDIISKGIQCEALIMNGRKLEEDKSVQECGIAGASLIAA